ncbi:MAG: redoxin domain-containing protein [Gemmatimonadota bacterium]|nr:redoxin domain-containing protein [Gemmatimonadota bacterium]
MEQAALQESLPEITAKGASVLTLSPQLPDFARLWAEEDGIEFDVLLDLGNQVARDYGLTFALSDDLRDVYESFFKIDLARFNGDESWQLPVPATFVIDTNGRIVYAGAHADYTARPEPAEAVAAIPTSD